jgi:hypothetical protein
MLWGATVGLENEGLLNVDPLLEERMDGLRTPGAESPALNSGSLVEAAAVDFDGQARLQPPDIGADESIEGGILQAPLLPTSVGPTWVPEGFPLRLIEVDLERSSAVSIGLLNDQPFGYGFYSFEVSSDLSFWTNAMPNQVDFSGEDNVSKSQLPFDEQTGPFWRLVFKEAVEPSGN